MNVESQLKTPLTHIRNLVKHVNKRNFNETCEHIKQVSLLYTYTYMCPPKFSNNFLFFLTKTTTKCPR